MGQLAKVTDNIMALLLRQMLTWTLTAVLVIFFLPHKLGDTGLGKINFAIALTSILLVLTNLGTSTFTIKQIALDRSRISHFLWNAYLLRLALGLPIAAGIVLGAHISGEDATSKMVLTIASVTFIIMSLDAAQVAVIQGLENMRRIAMADVANKVTVTALGIALLVTGHGVISYALVLLVGSTASLLLNGTYLAFRHLERPNFSVEIAKLLLIGGFPFFLTSAIVQFYMWFDTVILGVLTRDAVVGWFSAASQLYATMNVVPLVIVTAILPALTRFHAEDKESMRVTAEKSMQAVLLTGIPLALALMLLSGDIIRFLRYPPEFHNSIPLLSLLAISLPITGSLMLIGTIVIAADKQKAWAATMAVVAVLHLVLTIPLIVLFQRFNGNGAIGSAVASVSTESVLILLGIRLVPAGVLGRGTLRTLSRSLAAALVMVAAMGAAKLAFQPGLIPLFLIGSPVYCVALLAFGGITRDELKFLISTLISSRRAKSSSPAGLSPVTVTETEGDGF